MTKTKHKNQVGQASKNGGEFAAKTHDEALAVTLPPAAPTIPVAFPSGATRDLDNDDVQNLQAGLWSVVARKVAESEGFDFHGAPLVSIFGDRNAAAAGRVTAVTYSHRLGIIVEFSRGTTVFDQDREKLSEQQAGDLIVSLAGSQ